MKGHIESLGVHISSLRDEMLIASAEPYEVSEPFYIGGPSGNYELRSPYTGQVQFCVDAITGKDAASYSILVSPDQNRLIPGFAATDTPLGLFGGKGLLYLGQTGVSIPITSNWYDITNVERMLYVTIQSTLAAYAVIQFRHKR